MPKCQPWTNKSTSIWPWTPSPCWHRQMPGLTSFGASSLSHSYRGNTTISVGRPPKATEECCSGTTSPTEWRRPTPPGAYWTKVAGVVVPPGEGGIKQYTFQNYGYQPYRPFQARGSGRPFLGKNTNINILNPPLHILTQPSPKKGENDTFLSPSNPSNNVGPETNELFPVPFRPRPEPPAPEGR